MELKELRNKLVDVTGKIWRETESDNRGHVFQWIHPDAPKGREIDGVEISWLPGTGHVAVYSSDKELMFMQKVIELDKRLEIAVDYAQMAGGLKDQFPTITNLPTLESCTLAVEAIWLSEDHEPGFSGSADGVSWWTKDNYVAEYDNTKQAFVIWHEGMYWIAGTPKGYVDALAKAAIDIELMEFNRLKRLVSEK
jgi:hypothetical protein